MKILAFAGSSSQHSINKQLVSYATTLFSGHSVEILDLNDYEMPIYCIDKETQHGIPQPALDFAAKVDDADFILLSLAEHNGAYTTAFKNIFDWISRIPNRKAWGEKPMLLMATSPGARGGASVLDIAKNRFPHNGAEVVDTFSLPSFSSHFDSEKQCISNPEKDEELKAIVAKITG